MEIFSMLLALCEGNQLVTDGFPSQRPVMWSFDVFVDLSLNNGWVNNRGASDVRRHHTHYDVTVMCVMAAGHNKNPQGNLASLHDDCNCFALILACHNTDCTIKLWKKSKSEWCALWDGDNLSICHLKEREVHLAPAVMICIWYFCELIPRNSVH